MFEILLQHNDLWLQNWQNHIQLLVLFVFIVRVLKIPTVKYYFAYGFYVGTAMLFGIVYSFIFLLRPRNPKNIRLAAPPALLISRAIGIHWELRGEANLKNSDAGVMVINHKSIFDALGLVSIGASLGSAMSIARKEVFYFIPFGVSAWLSGVHFIDRHDRKKSLQTLMETGAKCKQIKSKVVVFPEGTRNRQNGTLLPFKTGAFKLAITNQLPIHPVVISDYYFVDSSKRTFEDGHVIMSALPPIPTEGLTMDDLDALVQKTRTTMLEHYKMLREEVARKVKEESLEKDR